MSQDLKNPRRRSAPSGKSLTQDAPPRRRILRRISAWHENFIDQLRRFRRHWRHVIREEKAHHFPESNRTLVALILFFWGMLPMAGSLLQERLTGRRRRTMRRSGRFLSVFTRIHPVAVLVFGCIIAGTGIFFSLYTSATTVTYDGRVLATVASTSVAEHAKLQLENTVTRTLGETYTLDSSLLQYDSHLTPRKDVVDEETYTDELMEQVGIITKAYSLYIDGVRIASTPYEGTLEELLRQMKHSASTEETISCDFKESVTVVPEYVYSQSVTNLGHIAQLLSSTKTEEVTYEVKKGDTWSEIAEDHGLTSNELLALNPGYNINKLQIGEVLTLSASVPFLTMTVVQQERYVDAIPFPIENTDTDTLYKGDYKVTSPGEYGAADVVANVTYVNGEVVERTILSSVELKAPVTEYRLQGTKERPTWMPTGSFRWPTSGRITSYFGGRRSPGGVGSTNHKGIDIANSKGTAIYAADGGTVTYAGWMSGYGYLVRIDHGNGCQTYYGHNSRLLVSSGQHVYKGQQIAKMGSTGNSTGNHCHFEIRVNGVAKNPLNYLP